MNAQTVVIEGPMHPDLFGGETPIMLEVPIKEAGVVYAVDVDVEYIKETTIKIFVIAHTEELAKELAEGKACDEVDGEIEQSQVTVCRLATSDEVSIFGIDSLDNMKNDFHEALEALA